MIRFLGIFLHPFALTLLLAGCGEDRPVLSMEALVSAARQCGAAELEFVRPAKDRELPSFSYLDAGPMPQGKPTPTSECMAKALEGYRFQSMTIRLSNDRTPNP